MAYYWRCKKHNEVMFEKLDESGSRIIPYCGHCKCNKEFEKIKAKQEAEYQKEYIRRFKEYQKNLEQYRQELLRPSFLKKLPAYIIGFVFIVLGVLLANFYFEEDNKPTILLNGIINLNGISEKLFDLFGGLFLIIVGGFVIYEIYISKPKEPEKPVIEKPKPPSITTMYIEKVEEFKLLQAEVNYYKDQLKRQFDNETISTYEMNVIDSMDGFEFEEYVAILLKNLGFSQAYVTQRSGDYGADIIAIDKDNLRVAVQCKRYGRQNLVGNDAIQQIHSAKDYYDCQKSLVVTTSYFTKPAFQMAQKIGVELWNRKTLKERIASVTKESWNDYLSKYYIKPLNKIPLANDKVDFVKHESF